MKGRPLHIDALPPAARRAVALTWAGMWWERLARAFWVPVTLAMLAVAALALGLVAALPPAALGWVSVLWALAFLAALLAGWMRFRRPVRAEALARVDMRIAGRPLSVLGDRMALGGPGAEALWRAHLDAARKAAAQARRATPDAGLPRRDPFALRLVGLTALAMALLFGGAGPVGQGLGALAASWAPSPRGPDEPVATGPAWEGWAEPPRHTRRPTIYLNALKGDALTVPEGTVLSFRLYGQGLGVEQDVGAAVESPPDAPRFTAQENGIVSVAGRSFTLTVDPDDAPSVQLAALAERRADGRMAQGFAAGDDHGIASGLATMDLDLPAVDRRFGLVPDPEPREALVLDLPLPAAGQRRQVEGTITADLARHPWANLPVLVRLQVQDGIGQSAETAPTAMILPGRRFFDPLAAGLVEMRRDLLWSRENAARSARLLRAMVWRPGRNIPPEAAAAIVAAVQTLEAGPLSPEARDKLADALWDAAMQIEDGGLGDALDRMRQAQERLSEAIRNGASPDEIQKLMDELKAATDDYTRMLAERGEDPAARFDRSEQQGQAVTGDQIQQMMDEIQRLMNEGRMAEAQELLEQFNRMMENMQVREGQGGGEGSPGGRSMEQLGDTLREQQRLADEAMREAQRDPFGQNPFGQQPGEGEQQGQGQQGQQGAGQGGEGQDGQGSLADRQRGLREELGRQQGLLPGQGTPEGDAARQRLDEAGRAMENAERALRGGDPAGAMEGQADAIEAMREGMRALSDLARSQQGEQGQAQDGEGNQPGQQGQSRADGGEGFSDRATLDPLGRQTRGQGSNVTTGEPLAEGERQANRARELQDEIRRRSGDADRPRVERDYLGRLLDRF
ncbi:DUF4175 domain-containing protein [Paracoccus sp. MC1854]|uniref:DUF4175 domain-containing protein n=1 Tax=Paracoccus sp. MC1854 TaxID=2760306 RepID=UPI00351C158B